MKFDFKKWIPNHHHSPFCACTPLVDAEFAEVIQHKLVLNRKWKLLQAKLLEDSSTDDL